MSRIQSQEAGPFAGFRDSLAARSLGITLLHRCPAPGARRGETARRFTCLVAGCAWARSFSTWGPSTSLKPLAAVGWVGGWVGVPLTHTHTHTLFFVPFAGIMPCQLWVGMSTTTIHTFGLMGLRGMRSQVWAKSSNSCAALLLSGNRFVLVKARLINIDEAHSGPALLRYLSKRGSIASMPLPCAFSCFQSVPIS